MFSFPLRLMLFGLGVQVFTPSYANIEDHRQRVNKRVEELRKFFLEGQPLFSDITHFLTEEPGRRSQVILLDKGITRDALNELRHFPEVQEKEEAGESFFKTAIAPLIPDLDKKWGRYDPIEIYLRDFREFIQRKRNKGFRPYTDLEAQMMARSEIEKKYAQALPHLFASDPFYRVVYNRRVNYFLLQENPTGRPADLRKEFELWVKSEKKKLTILKERLFREMLKLRYERGLLNLSTDQGMKLDSVTLLKNGSNSFPRIVRDNLGWVNVEWALSHSDPVYIEVGSRKHRFHDSSDEDLGFIPFLKREDFKSELFDLHALFAHDNMFDRVRRNLKDLKYQKDLYRLYKDEASHFSEERHQLSAQIAKNALADLGMSTSGAPSHFMAMVQKLRWAAMAKDWDHWEKMEQQAQKLGRPPLALWEKTSRNEVPIETQNLMKILHENEGGFQQSYNQGPLNDGDSKRIDFITTYSPEISAHSRFFNLRFSDEAGNAEIWKPDPKSQPTRLRLESARPLYIDPYKALSIPTPEGAKLLKLELKSPEGSPYILGKDFNVLELTDGRRGYFLEWMNPAEAQPLVLYAHFDMEETPPSLPPELSLLDSKKLRPLVKKLKEANFLKHAEDLNKLLDSRSKISVHDIERIFQQHSLYTYEPARVRSHFTDNPFTAFTKVLDEDLKLCTQCHAGNAFFTKFMQDYFKGNPDVSVRLKRMVEDNKGLHFYPLHAQTEFLFGARKESFTMDLTPQAQKSKTPRENSDTNEKFLDFQRYAEQHRTPPSKSAAEDFLERIHSLKTDLLEAIKNSHEYERLGPAFAERYFSQPNNPAAFALELAGIVSSPEIHPNPKESLRLWLQKLSPNAKTSSSSKILSHLSQQMQRPLQAANFALDTLSHEKQRSTNFPLFREDGVTLATIELLNALDPKGQEDQFHFLFKNTKTCKEILRGFSLLAPSHLFD